MTLLLADELIRCEPSCPAEPIEWMGLEVKSISASLKSTWSSFRLLVGEGVRLGAMFLVFGRQSTSGSLLRFLFVRVEGRSSEETSFSHSKTDAREYWDMMDGLRKLLWNYRGCMFTIHRVLYSVNMSPFDVKPARANDWVNRVTTHVPRSSHCGVHFALSDFKSCPTSIVTHLLTVDEVNFLSFSIIMGQNTEITDGSYRRRFNSLSLKVFLVGKVFCFIHRTTVTPWQCFFLDKSNHIRTQCKTSLEFPNNDMDRLLH